MDSRADLEAALNNGKYNFSLHYQQGSEIRDLVKPVFRFVDILLGVTADAAKLVSVYVSWVFLDSPYFTIFLLLEI